MNVNTGFAITATTVTVTAPNGGESLTGGQSYSITWTNTGIVDHYRLSLSTDGGATFPTTIMASTRSSPFAWTVPNTGTGDLPAWYQLDQTNLDGYRLLGQAALQAGGSPRTHAFAMTKPVRARFAPWSATTPRRGQRTATRREVVW